MSRWPYFPNSGLCFSAVALPTCSLRIPGNPWLSAQPPSCLHYLNPVLFCCSRWSPTSTEPQGHATTLRCAPWQLLPAHSASSGFPETACCSPCSLLPLFLSPFIRVLSSSILCLPLCGHLLCLGFFAQSCVPRMEVSFVPRNMLRPTPCPRGDPPCCAR